MLTIVTVRFWLFVASLIAVTITWGGMNDTADWCLALTWGVVFIVIGLANISHRHQ